MKETPIELIETRIVANKLTLATPCGENKRCK